MKSTFSVIASFVTFLAIWVIAAIIIRLITPAYDSFIFGIGSGLMFENIMVWLFSPLLGAYYALKCTKIWFPDVKGDTIFVGFVAVCSTFAILLLIFNVLILFGSNSSLISWLEVVGFVVQFAAVLLGAAGAKNELH